MEKVEVGIYQTIKNILIKSKKGKVFIKKRNYLKLINIMSML